MKKLIGVLFSILISSSLFAQTSQIYKPEANAKAEIQQAVKQAKAEGKHVFLQIGGNWCPWCIKFHRFVENDSEIKAFVDANFNVVKVNYSKENKNLDVLKSLDYPQRFGFPVFVVLNGNGERIHTQNSAYLEKDGAYDSKEVLLFYKQWSPKALAPSTYHKQER
ncbi:thioredoxin family protein [Sunxiuqinia sp. sy24]|uniref:thioredoxin family protein n=1 Tax=Sunxiuqinia sp. sy24 TaxID=3461495 RepID=UPI004045D0F3